MTSWFVGVHKRGKTGVCVFGKKTRRLAGDSRTACAPRTSQSDICGPKGGMRDARVELREGEVKLPPSTFPIPPLLHHEKGTDLTC